jgi:hypothetical protein
MAASASGTIFPQTITARVAAAAAADATADQVVGVAGVAGSVLTVTFTPDTVLTGADTNSATLSVVNKGTGGAGTAVVASKAFTNGVNAAATDETDITLTVTAADAVVAVGDVLVLRRTKVGTGLATPAGLVRIKIGAS